MENQYNTELLVPVSMQSIDPAAVSRSSTWAYWMSWEDLKRCPECEALHGKVYDQGKPYIPNTPEHYRCRCDIVPMLCIMAGFATTEGNNGADWWLKNTGRLPEYYISNEDIEALGWKKGKEPAKYAPSRMVTMGIYHNRNGHLPNSRGRIWYEADVSYYKGKRNSQRILWSNDGLIFVTYDHYKTFIEIQ